MPRCSSLLRVSHSQGGGLTRGHRTILPPISCILRGYAVALRGNSRPVRLAQRALWEVVHALRSLARERWLCLGDLRDQVPDFFSGFDFFGGKGFGLSPGCSTLKGTGGGLGAGSGLLVLILRLLTFCCLFLRVTSLEELYCQDRVCT